MKNVTFAGMIAGLSGSVVNIFARLFLKSLGIAEQSFHYIGQWLHFHVGLFGFNSAHSHVPVHIGIGILSGIIFAHYIHLTTPKNILIKGALFTSSLWLILLGAGAIWKFPLLIQITPLSAVLIYINLVIFGIVKALVIRKLFHVSTTL